MTSRERSYLMKLASTMEPIIQIGKSGITPELTTEISEALEARELIKITILKNCPEDIREAAGTLSSRTRSQVVQIIGRRIVLYRESKKKKR